MNLERIRALAESERVAAISEISATDGYKSVAVEIGVMIANAKERLVHVDTSRDEDLATKGEIRGYNAVLAMLDQHQQTARK